MSQHCISLSFKQLECNIRRSFIFVVAEKKVIVVLKQEIPPMAYLQCVVLGGGGGEVAGGYPYSGPGLGCRGTHVQHLAGGRAYPCPGPGLGVEGTLSWSWQDQPRPGHGYPLPSHPPARTMTGPRTRDWGTPSSTPPSPPPSSPLHLPLPTPPQERTWDQRPVTSE